MIAHGVEGIGKTSLPASATSPLYLMAKGETGLETLIDSGRLPEIPHLPEIQSWEELTAVIDELLASEHNFRTLVLDTLNGFEQLCHSHICNTQYGGNWGNKGFASFQQGYDVSLGEWRLMLSKLDQLREEKSMAIVCLCHTHVRTFKNPEGPDFDRYQPDLHHKTWSVTHKWADIVLFLNYLTVVDESGNRPKGAGGHQRWAYTERTAAWDAKNRHGLPSEFELGESGEEGWNNFRNAIKEGRSK